MIVRIKNGEIQNDYKESRELTSTTKETGSGIFEDNEGIQKYNFGEIEVEIKHNSFPPLIKENEELIKKEILSRIQQLEIHGERYTFHFTI